MNKTKPKEVTIYFRADKAGPGTARFATILGPAMLKAGFTRAAQLAAKIGVSREHVRKLLANEAQPSKPLCFAISQAVDVDESSMWKAAQLDRLERKFGHTIVSEKQGKNPRVALFEPLLLALTEEQVPAALAMLKGLTSGQRGRKS